MHSLNTVCPRDCYDTCFMKVELDNENKPVRIVGDKENPITQGVLCPRGVMDIKRAYSSARILYPHQRVGEKPDGEFKRVSWDYALDLLVKHITQTIDRYGPDSILHLEYAGNQGLFTLFLPQRLFYALGCSRTDYTLCSESGHAALSLHYGLTYGVDPDELSDMQLTVFWGFNAAISASHLYKRSLITKKEGGLIAVIDPRRSETVRTADIWIRPKPGSDVTLAYGIMKHLIETERVDYNFLTEYTHGFDKLQNTVSTWNTDVIEEYTGVGWDQIVELAELYASRKPSVTMIGIGLQKSLYGAESVRAISLIPALVGLHRGFYYTNREWDIDFSYLLGRSLTNKPINTVSQVALGNQLEKGDFKFIYVYNMNPVETVPNHNAVKKGFTRKDVFVVVHDTHWTETAQRADLVLPAQTFLEKEDIQISYSHRYVRTAHQIIDPIGESKSELWITNHLISKLNLQEAWLNENPWDAIAKAVKHAFENGDISDLMEGRILKLKLNPKNEYQTPSNKIELFATQAKNGITPLPIQHPVPGSDEYIFLNTAIRKYTHTQFQDVYGPIPPTILVHPTDAEQHAIQDDDIVELRNSLGRIQLKVIVSHVVPKGVLWAPHEGKDINGIAQNTIIPGTVQQLGGGPIFNTTRATLTKVHRA